MNSNESRCTITKFVNLKNNFKSSLQRQYPDSSVRGGMFSDFELAWLYNGPLLRISDASTGTVISAWDFTTVTHDNRTEITSIIEYYIPESNRSSMKENQLYFIVSYTSRKDPTKASFISLCHPRTSRILHTITTTEKVTCLSLITAKKDHSNPIAGIVKLMCGALAVGTTAGNLLIVDIKEIFTCARQGCVDRKQNRFSEMVIMELKHNENNIKEKLNKSDEFHHVAVSLSMTDRKEREDHGLKITALTYIPQCTMLAVGLKNGVFQLWDVSTLKKLYRSSVLSAPTPVVRFGFQEPCNDPQSFCYLWVLYESQAEQNDILPFAIMHACLFKKIVTVPEYGIHYKNFVHCKKRFDLDIDMERSISGRCIACSKVSNTPSNILRHVTSVEEDASKINLFVVVFETWEQVSDSNSRITLIIFDMNQWYKAQMPQLIYQGGSVQFVNFQVLEHLSERKGTVMDMRIQKDTIQQFLSFNLSEEYSYPSSLSFDTLVLTDSKIVHVRFPGAQRNVLDKIVSEGPSGIINPNKYFSECKDVGLWPYFSNSFNNLFAPTQVQQRNFILTLLLEHKFSSFLVSCVKQWADGSRGVSGCTLPNLIRWAWDCVTRIKQLTDTVCIPLFDYSGDDLDRENYQKLKHCVQLMHTIKDLLTHILKNYRQYLLEEEKLKHQVDALKLITKYFDTIIWCLDCNLLPEKVTSSSEKCVPTYMMNLMQYTEQRRDELRNIVTKDHYFCTESNPPYIIDSVLEYEANGKQMRSQWERESNGLSNGSYPPVTLQSLLRMFLMPGLSNDAKNFIMIYFLLDVCDYHRDEDMKEQLLSFSVVFSIDSAFFLLVQACWFVDHEKFEDAAGLLLNDAVISQLKSRRELYRTLMLACVCQGQYQLALRIEKLTKLSRTVFNDDTFSVTVLLLNGLVMDAYFTMKENPIKQKKLLRHFFRVCDNLGYLKELFKFPLSPEEEEEFMIYLDSSGNKDAGDLKVMYLLSRGRYVEAIDVNHQLGSTVPKFSIVGQDTTTQKTGIGRTTTRDILVNAFGKTLPVVTNDLINFCRKEKNKIARFKTVAKPTPLSVVVHTDTSNRIPIYKSSFESVMEAAICKTAETWTNVSEILKRKRGQLDLKNTPFLRSNFMTPRKNASLYSEREKLSTIQEKSLDADEPPTKRVRKSIFSLDTKHINDSFEKDESTRLSASVDTSNILCTPHVQKRLNKLLRNTPESSPLTSILKNSESRFRQPQKVGFSVPETDVRRSKRLSASQSRSPPKSRYEENTTKGDAVLPIESGGNSYVSRNRICSSSSESQNSSNTSTAPDSFYSLDSESDRVYSITEFVQEPNAATPFTSNFSIEVMSEDDTSFRDHTSKNLIMECMSEEETSSINASKIISDSPREEKVIWSSQASKLTIENMSDGERSSTSHAWSPISDNAVEEKTSTLDRVAGFMIESTRSKNETLQPIRLRFDETKQEHQIVHVEVHAPFSNVADSETASEKETTSFTALQPVPESSIYKINDENKSSSDTYFREEFSIDTFEKETILEQVSQELDDDSDIEILDGPSSDKQVAEDDDSNLTVSNDESSEKTYESDYSDSENSVQTSSDIVEEEDEIQDIENAEMSIDKEEEDSSQYEEEEYEDEDELSVQEEGEEQEDEISVQEEKEEQEVKDKEEAEENLVQDVSDDEADDEKSLENMKKLGNEHEHLEIDYDSLKAIMSTVNSAETNETESVATKLRSNDPSSSTLSNKTIPGSSVVTEQNEVTTDTDVGEVTNYSDISVETLSVSCVDKDQTADEPQLVFYFGENSVTSISEKLLNDESINQSAVEATQKTEDFSIIAVTEEHEDDDLKETESLKQEMDVSYRASETEDTSAVSLHAQKTEDFSILAITEDQNFSLEDVSSSEKINVFDATRKNASGVQNISGDSAEHDVEELSSDEDVIANETTNSPKASLSRARELDILSKSNKSIMQSPNVSIGLVEEMVGDITQTEHDLVVVRFEEAINETCAETGQSSVTQTEHDLVVVRSEEAINETCAETGQSSGEEDPELLRSSKPCISIGVAEEIVGNLTQTSTNSPVIIELEKIDRPARTGGNMDEFPVLKDSLRAVEEIGASKADEKYSRIRTTSDQIHNAENVASTLSNCSEDLGESANSHTLVPPTSSVCDIVEMSKLQSSPDKKESASESPTKKAESERSYTMSIPDSPTGMLVIDEPSATPSRRSARIARRQSTENIPQTVLAKSIPTLRTTRKRSTDSADDASDISLAESVTSNTSKSSSRKRSLLKLDTKKSSMKPPFNLKVIKSDEELSDENSNTDDDRLSSISKASSPSNRSNRRTSASKLNTAILQTPSPHPKKRVLREFANAASEMSPKPKLEEDYENYANSRRMTRSQQKSLFEYGISLVSTSVASPTPINDAELGNVQVDKIDEVSTSRTRTSARLLKEKSSKREDDGSSKSGKVSVRDRAIVRTNSDSSDDSSYSQASTASRRAKSGRRSTRTGTHLELRKSSVRPQFKPLSVVPSDEESTSHSVAEDDPASQTSLSSLRSQTTRSMKRSQKNESEQSDRESLLSDVSGSPSSRLTRRTRRLFSSEEIAKPAARDRKSIPPPQKKKK